MRAEFVRDADGTKVVVGSASWTGSGLTFEAPSEEARTILDRIFRASPVSTDDPSLRSFGTHGEVVLQPGSLQWFLAAAGTRVTPEGLEVRFVADDPAALGWDPAGAYRTFAASTERLVGGPART